jgi:hypothetical protein
VAKSQKRTTPSFDPEAIRLPSGLKLIDVIRTEREPPTRPSVEGTGRLPLILMTFDCAPESTSKM